MAVAWNGVVGWKGRGRLTPALQVTGRQAQRHAHTVRDRVDAILVGVGTILADDPQLTTRLSYVDLVEGSAIDIAISPQQSTVSALLAHVRRGDMVRVHSLRRGAAEAIEAVAHGDRKSSKVVGRRLDEIKLPAGCTIGAIVRGEQVMIAHHDTLIEAEDHVILFIVNKKHTREVERLFQVGLGFL